MTHARRHGVLLAATILSTFGAVSAAHGVSADASRDQRPYLDSRQARTPAASARRATNVAANARAAVRAIRGRLGRQGIVSLDAVTGTPRVVARLDGYLTRRSRQPAARVALGFVRSNLRAFGLTRRDLVTFRLVRDYVSIDGTHHLYFVQQAGGIPVFGNELRANVTRDGRLINLLGAPLAALRSTTRRPRLGPGAARAFALRDAGGRAVPVRSTSTGGPRRETAFAGGDRASLVWFHTTLGTRLAWQTTVRRDGTHAYVSVVDARSGAILYRRSLVDYATGLAWGYYPGAVPGGAQTPIGFTARGWLPATATTLHGNNAHAWTDVDDDNVAEPAEEVGPTSGNWNYVFAPFTLPNCPAVLRCSWDPSTPFSWQRNRAQTTTQTFFFVNQFHDHLAGPPIGFTEAAGNFQLVNATGRGKGGDAVLTQADDGAAMVNGLPDANHIDNANMDTPPDGQAPTMQMYLGGAPPDAGDPYIPGNNGDDALTVFHEYTHGLSNRLLVDALGVSTLGNGQAGAMGEAWSDWYAFDYEADIHNLVDTPVVGDVNLDVYLAAGAIGLTRSESIDCPVGETSDGCPRGGYTYADYGRVTDGPEVHADGEIWAQTLWQLRTALGAPVTESIVTRAMELAPANPSFLDMRNAILQADTVDNGGRARAVIWATFAERGMGYAASAISGDDTAPTAAFDLPPAPGGPVGSARGQARDAQTGATLRAVVVAVGGHASGFADDLVASTGAGGRYRIARIPYGSYPSLIASKPGYDAEVVALRVAHAAERKDFTLARDWSSRTGGAVVAASNDVTGAAFGCGPDAAIDQTGNGWESAIVGGQATPKFVTVRLPATVNVSAFGVDPSNTCGDGGSASTGDYRIEVSANGTKFRTVATGTFTPANRNRLNIVAPSGTTGPVRYVRFWMLSPQVPGGPAACPGFSGCDFMDLTELEVYGARPGQRIVSAAPPASRR